MTEFERSVAVVTGGASGIGRSLALMLAQRGARVAVADLDLKQAEAVAETIGPVARAYRCDVTERKQLVELSRMVMAEWGAINYVFANAGVAIGGSILTTESGEFDWLFDVNVRGVFSTIQTFVPLLLETASKGGRAHIVVTGSENSLGVPLTAATSVYTATKHAVLALADTLRRDLKESGVGVSILCPGVVETRIFDARRSRQDRYGGRADMPPDFFERASKAMAQGQKPNTTATLCLDGVARGDFLIITDPKIRGFATQRHREVESALDRLDATLAGGNA
jgi:NAD(P)-dependent dehydrogenase (short-subunit alcohol dehydrogenase family)